MISAIVNPANRWTTVATGIMLILFGISDWIELSTGAWWKPWWLFVWKAVCVVSLVSLGVVAYRKQTKEIKSSSLTESKSQKSEKPLTQEPQEPT